VGIHVVKEGECINSIAMKHGFFWDVLWNHQGNTQLRRKRENPNVLMTGDEIFIPEKRIKEESGATEKTHTFMLKGVPVRLNFELVDVKGNPRVGIKWTLTVDGAETSDSTDDKGRISAVIDPAAKKAQLILETGEKYDFDLGKMDPVDTPTGLKARLKNLGYYHGEITPRLGEASRDAIRKFQRAHGMDPTGEPTPEMRQALLQEHQG
jgi:hypothetical protein